MDITDILYDTKMKPNSKLRFLLKDDNISFTEFIVTKQLFDCFFNKGQVNENTKKIFYNIIDALPVDKSLNLLSNLLLLTKEEFDHNIKVYFKIDFLVIILNEMLDKKHIKFSQITALDNSFLLEKIYINGLNLVTENEKERNQLVTQIKENIFKNKKTEDLVSYKHKFIRFNRYFVSESYFENVQALIDILPAGKLTFAIFNTKNKFYLHNRIKNNQETINKFQDLYVNNLDKCSVVKVSGNYKAFVEIKELTLDGLSNFRKNFSKYIIAKDTQDVLDNHDILSDKLFDDSIVTRLGDNYNPFKFKNIIEQFGDKIDLVYTIYDNGYSLNKEVVAYKSKIKKEGITQLDSDILSNNKVLLKYDAIKYIKKPVVNLIKRKNKVPLSILLNLEPEMPLKNNIEFLNDIYNSGLYSFDEFIEILDKYMIKYSNNIGKNSKMELAIFNKLKTDSMSIDDFDYIFERYLEHIKLPEFIFEEIRELIYISSKFKCSPVLAKRLGFKKIEQ